MCGIVGKYYFNENNFQNDDLHHMMRAIHHRGPDSDGEFINDDVAIGFKRLSIIDTLKGDQPFFNENKKIVAVVNGEIYNFKELRNALSAKGHVFRSNSDCEVVVHLYEEYGRSFFDKLNGMFAICLFDIEKRVLFIARDRIGIKPFYTYMDKNVFLFASEIKGILAVKEVLTEPEKNVLGEYLCFRFLSGRRTFFSEIKSVEPGTCIEISKGALLIWKYCSSRSKDCSGKYERDADLADQIRHALYGSVDRQLVSDVPVGTLLSGGVDSSWVSVVANSIMPGIRTFTVGFNESAYDESPYAKLVAKTFNLNYHELKIGPEKFSETLPKAIWFNDEPLCHANSVHIYLICNYAREFVKVLLTGEGADEFFGGYPRYFVAKLSSSLQRPPLNLINPFLRISRSFWSRKGKKIVDSLALNDVQLVLWNSLFVEPSKVAWLIGEKEVDISCREKMLDHLWSDGVSVMDNLLRFEQKTYLHSILLRQDKMSMAASIESRVPILDNQMLALANSITAAQKIRRMRTKYLFKKAASIDLPRTIVQRAKVGFGVPIGDWIRDRNGLGQYIELLMDISVDMDINRKRLETIIAEHNDLRSDHSDVLWPLINYAIWYEKFF